MFSGRGLRRAVPACALALAMFALSGCFGFSQQGDGEGAAEKGSARKPNIVFVLTDDLSWKLVAHMPQVKRMQAEGVTFDNFLVADSLCCTSRATFSTGMYPHNTNVRTNFPPLGGYGVFKREGGEQEAFAPALQKAGYQTAMLGKYINGYHPRDPETGSTNVPPGWNEWYVAGNGYPEFGYNLNENGRVVSYGKDPKDYMTDVLAYKGLDFIKRAGSSGQPFFVQISTFAPHGPFVPAPRHADLFPDLKVPRTPSFNEADVSDKPNWLRRHEKLDAKQIGRIDRGFRDRVRMVQSVDEMLGRIRTTLDELGVAEDTIVIFGSDNGFHMGEHRLAGGKMTPYTIDIRVPFVFVGPGITAGGRVGQIAQNTDMAPTFRELAGAPIPEWTDGRSLVPFLHGEPPADWRDTALVEHVKPAYTEQDPDRQDALPGAPTTYNALRTTEMLYVEYADGEREYYDLTRDPHHLTNIAATLAPERQRRLTARLYALTQCAGQACWAAGRTR